METDFQFCFRFKDIAARSKEMLLSLGFPQFTLEDFHDVVRNKTKNSFMVHLHVSMINVLSLPILLSLLDARMTDEYQHYIADMGSIPLNSIWSIPLQLPNLSSYLEYLPRRVYFPSRIVVEEIFFN